MAAVALDTSIIIDLMQGHPPAVAWQQTQTDLSAVYLSTIVRMEVIEGVLNRRMLERTLRFLSQFPNLETRQADLDLAADQFAKLHLSLGVDLADCIIAAPCQREQLTLYTRNLKHFRPLLNTLAVAPY